MKEQMQTTSAQIYAHSIQWCNSSSFSVIKVVQQERTWGYFHNETIKTYPSHLSIGYPNVFPYRSTSYSECYINLENCSSMIITIIIFRFERCMKIFWNYNFIRYIILEDFSFAIMLFHWSSVQQLKDVDSLKRF